jgi:hypothetical protein
MAEKRRWTVATVLALLGIALLFAADARAQRSCDKETMDTWLELRRGSLGVSGSDPHPILAPNVVPDRDQPLVRSCPNEVDFSLDQEGRAVDGIHSWVFAHPCKLTICGEPRSFEENRRFYWLWGEYDLNNNIEFDEVFRENRLNRHLCIPGSEDAAPSSSDLLLAMQEPRLCFPETQTLHVEITPPEALRPLMRRMWLHDTPRGWYRWRDSLYDRTACVFGPFVADTAHAALAEIHPAQLYWWNERLDAEPVASETRPPFAPDGPFALFLIQDASNRYTQNHHFVLKDAPPEGSDWRPWAYGPLEGVYDVAFWSPKDAPPDFELTQYEYLGVTAPSPIARECELQEQKAEVLRGEAAVYARICNRTGRKGGTGIDVESQWLCECDPAAKPEEVPETEWCDTPGFLGKLTLRMRAGGSREWREGFLAVRLTDKRSGGRRMPVVTETDLAQEAVSSRALTPQLAWKPHPQPAWAPLDLEEAAGPRAAEARRHMFDAAEWPEGMDHPMTPVWRLLSVELTADVAVPELRDKDRKEKKVTAHYEKVRATPLAGGQPIDLSFDRIKGRKARVSLEALPETEVHQLDVCVNMSVRYPQQAPTVVETGLERQPMTGDRVLPTKDWTLWSHGLGAEPGSEWHEGARSLCEHHRRKARPKDPSDRPGPGTLDADLQTAVGRVLKDEVVSMTELTLLVRDIRRLCRAGDELRPAARPTRLQAK